MPLRRWWRRRRRGWRRRRATRSCAVAARSGRHDRRNRQPTRHRHNASIREELGYYGFSNVLSYTRFRQTEPMSWSETVPVVLVLLALERVSRQSRRDDRIPAGKPCPRQEEETPKEQRHANLGQADGRPGTMIDGRHDFEIALEPDSPAADERNADPRRRE